MGTLIQGGKYQVLEVMEEQDGYKACLCIDVETNNHYRPMIFNIYEKSEDIKRLLPVFYDIDRGQCTDFVHVMSGKHYITAAFEHHQGEGLRDFFSRMDKYDFEMRCSYAYLLLEQCLILDAVDDFIAYACLEPVNIVVSEKLQKVMINYMIRPQRNDGESKGKKLAVLLECIFVDNRYVPQLLWEYIGSLRENEGLSIAAAFSRWKEIGAQLLKEHRDLKKEALIAYLFRRLKRAFMRKG